MARQQREDIFPAFLMRDTSPATRRAGRAAGEGWRGTAHDPDLEYKPYSCVYQAYHDLLSEVRNDVNGTAAESVFNIIISKFQTAEYDLINDVDPADNDGFVEENTDEEKLYNHRLRVCGCRAFITNKEIEDELRRKASTVTRAIKVLKKIGVIVNWRRGWLEIDAEFAWRGSADVRQAYGRVQPVHPRYRLNRFSAENIISTSPDQ